LVAEGGTNTRVVTYNFATSADVGRSDVNETLNIWAVPNNQLMLTSNHFRRGHLIEKTEYTHERRTTRYDYSILERNNVPLIPATLFTMRDFSISSGCNLSCPCANLSNPKYWHKDFGIVRYRIIPYNKRVTSIKETGGALPDRTRTFGYINPTTYSADRLANLPISETTLDARGNTITNYFTYTNFNQVHTRITVATNSNGSRIITAAHRNEFDNQGHLVRRYVAEIPPNGIPVIATTHQLGTSLRGVHSFNTLPNRVVETRTYRSYDGTWAPYTGGTWIPVDHYFLVHRLYELTDLNTGISTVYIWGYNGAHPIAEIQNLTAAQLETRLSSETLDNLFRSTNPDMSIVNNLREEFPDSRFTTFTYRPGVGVSSITDPRGTIVYFGYDNFGWLTETYMIENGVRQLLEKREYHWAFMHYVTP